MGRLNLYGKNPHRLYTGSQKKERRKVVDVRAELTVSVGPYVLDRL